MKHPTPQTPVVTLERAEWLRTRAELERLRKALTHYAKCPHATPHCSCTRVARALLYGAREEQP